MLVVSVLQPLFESEAWLIVVVSMEMESNLFASRLASKKEAELTIGSHPRTSSESQRTGYVLSVSLSQRKENTTFQNSKLPFVGSRK